MGFVKGLFCGVGAVVLGVVGAATVCAVHDLRKEEKENDLKAAELSKKHEEKWQKDAEIRNAAKESFEREVGGVFEKMKEKVSV